MVFYTSQSLFLGVIVLAKRLRSSYLKRTTLSVFCTRLSSYSFSLSWKKRSNKWIDVNWCIPVAEETKLWNINNMPNLFSFLFYKQWFIRSLPQPKGSVVRTCCLKDKEILTENYLTLLHFLLGLHYCTCPSPYHFSIEFKNAFGRVTSSLDISDKEHEGLSPPPLRELGWTWLR